MNAFKLWYHKLGSPPYFYVFAGYIQPWLWTIALALAAAGLYGGLVLAPPDYQQGDAFRIIFVHVPAAWMSLFVYGVMAVSAFIAVVWRPKMAEVLAMESASIGAAFTLIALVTGSLWGRPTWGTYWTWDARLTSELVLLFIYLGVIGLYHAFEDPRQGARAASFLAVVGAVNLPIVHYSVVWWNSLHQGALVFTGRRAMPPSMLIPLMVMFLGFTLYSVAVLCMRLRAEVLNRERTARWVREEVAA